MRLEKDELMGRARWLGYVASAKRSKARSAAEAEFLTEVIVTMEDLKYILTKENGGSERE